MSVGSFVKWLYPGMHVKRWLILLIFGVTFVALGIAYVLTHLYRTQPLPEIAGDITLQFIDRPIRGALFIAAGLALGVVALFQLSRSLLSPFLGGERGQLVEAIYQHRYLSRGPKIVAIGGGHGLSTLLRGLKEYTGNLTAVVTVADDGGSSGRLRREMGVLPPGDLRMCLVALAEEESLMNKLFQYRFEKGTGLEGHAFGNLFLVAMHAIAGNYERALRESSRVLAVRGQILPATLEDVHLVAEYEDGQTSRGESQLPEVRKPIRRIYLDPSPPGHAEAVRAILEADMIVIGPGSLYTSILPNLLVPDITSAVRLANAVKVYVCNVATQRGETDDFHVSDHVAALERHAGGSGLFQYVVVNDNQDTRGDVGADSSLVKMNGAIGSQEYKVVQEDVVDIEHPHYHDPKKLGACIMRLYYDRSTTRSEGQAEAPSEELAAAR